MKSRSKSPLKSPARTDADSSFKNESLTKKCVGSEFVNEKPTDQPGKQYMGLHQNEA